jgi:hypothetical protein
MLDTSGPEANPRLDKMAQLRHARGPPTPSMSTPAADFDKLTGSPPPPPTPAASPGPSHCQPDWSDAADDEDFFLAKVRQHFKNCSGPQRTRVLADLLNLCTSQQLSFVHQFVSPLLKKDPFTTLPNELCLRVSILCTDTSLRYSGQSLCHSTDSLLHRRPQGLGSSLASLETVAGSSERRYDLEEPM